MSISLNVKNFMDAASPLASFDPARGHYYIEPESGAADEPLPEGPAKAETNDLTISGIEDDGSSSTALGQLDENDKANVDDHPEDEPDSSLALLEETWNNFVQYRGEYIDENPLVGEPGSFRFAHPPKKTFKSSALGSTKSEEVKLSTLNGVSKTLEDSKVGTPGLSTVAESTGKAAQGKALSRSKSNNPSKPNRKPKKKKTSSSPDKAHQQPTRDDTITSAQC